MFTGKVVSWSEKIVSLNTIVMKLLSSSKIELIMLTPPFKIMIPVVEVSAMDAPPPSKIELSFAAPISIVSIPAAGGLKILRLRRTICSPPCNEESPGVLIPLMVTESTFPPFWLKFIEKSLCSNGFC